jgi:hypothetical protein
MMKRGVRRWPGNCKPTGGGGACGGFNLFTHLLSTCVCAAKCMTVSICSCSMMCTTKSADWTSPLMNLQRWEGHGHAVVGRWTRRKLSADPFTAPACSLEVGSILDGIQIVESCAVVELVQHHHLQGPRQTPVEAGRL